MAVEEKQKNLVNDQVIAELNARRQLEAAVGRNIDGTVGELSAYDKLQIALEQRNPLLQLLGHFLPRHFIILAGRSVAAGCALLPLLTLTGLFGLCALCALSFLCGVSLR